jgi:hypothetical protein
MGAPEPATAYRRQARPGLSVNWLYSQVEWVSCVASATPHDIEKWLNDNGVEWECQHDFALDDIDREKSLHNQARIFEPLDLEVVHSYGEAVKRGDIFPAIVVHKPGRSRAVLVDGNHRRAANDEALRTVVESYVITKARPQTIVAMSIEANTRHGKPTSVEERIHQAVWLMDNGMSKNEAAANVRLPDFAMFKLTRKEDKLREMRTPRQWIVRGAAPSRTGAAVQIITDRVGGSVVGAGYITVGGPVLSREPSIAA